MSEVDDDLLLTAADVAYLVGDVRPTLIARWAELGTIPCSWWGTRPLFRESEIERWLHDPAYRRQETIEGAQLPDPPPEPYQRVDGRWSVRWWCADGTERRFVSRGREPVQAEHQRKGRPRPPIPVRLRFNVLQRDHFTCRYCGRRPPEVALEIDHVLAVVDGGTDDADNLVTACVDCNLGKRERSVAAMLVPSPEVVTRESREEWPELAPNGVESELVLDE